MAFRVLLVGGGSGGHVYPLIAVARAMQKRAAAKGTNLELILMGDGPFVTRAGKEAGIPTSSIIAPKLRRYASAGNVLDIVKIPFALAQALLKLLWHMPDAVLCKGGYTCAFPTLAARLYFIPVYLHESDAVPGLANRILAGRSKLVFTSFPTADSQFRALGRATLLTGNPYRAELCCVERAAAHSALHLDPAKKTVFIAGGSQGAKQLNDIVLNALVQMVGKGWNVIHQCGDRNFKEVKAAVEQYGKEGASSYAPALAAQYRVYAFLDESQMAAAYGACDVAVVRAGANLLTELSAQGKPMVVVPLAGSANDHQTENAAELAKFGAITVDGANASTHIIMGQIEKLLDPATNTAVSQSIRGFAKPDAADAIAAAVLG
jgi:UDP-N-acetylglucosamine--N-acetylmuramyl-(pentapeptide) pyrophosphoryl-undecaprenol N-acetylglucosamine transferase